MPIFSFAYYNAAIAARWCRRPLFDDIALWGDILFDAASRHATNIFFIQIAARPTKCRHVPYAFYAAAAKHAGQALMSLDTAAVFTDIMRLLNLMPDGRPYVACAERLSPPSSPNTPHVTP